MRCCNLLQLLLLLLLLMLLPLHKFLVACPKYLFIMHMIPPWISLNMSMHPIWYLLPICCSFLLPSKLQSLVSSKHCILKQLRTKHMPQELSSKFPFYYSNIQNFFHQMVESHLEFFLPFLLRMFLLVVKLY
jgi:hypothetical protein